MKFKILILFLTAAIITSSCANAKIENNVNEKEQAENIKNLEINTIELKFEPVSKIKLQEGQPQENWIKGKSIYYGNLPNQTESTIHLYIENDNVGKQTKGGDIHGYLEHNGKVYDLGILSSYGLEDVKINLADRTSDDIKEFYITGGFGATYVEMKAIEYDSILNEWSNILTMGNPQIVDLDGDGQEELVAVSVGSLPGFVDVYRWNKDYFEKASITDATGNTYAYLYNEDDKLIIESGKLEEGKVTKTHYYIYENGKLIEVNL